MRSIGHILKTYWRQFVSVTGNELRNIFTDAGVLLVVVLAIFIYTTIYSCAYGTQVLRNVPLGVVDMCKTPESRALINTFSSGPNTVVAYEPASMSEAEEMFFARKIYGIVYIPSNYSKNLYGGMQANVSLYLDGSYLLMYRQAFQELVAGIGTTGAMVEVQRLISKGTNAQITKSTVQPIIYQTHNMFNPYLGYGSFVMPAIIIVIIQQTLLIGIGMLGGTWREHGLYDKLRPAGERRMATLPIVLGKATAYAMIYTVTLLIILNVLYRIFGFPMNGRTADIIAFMIPYLLACIFLSIAVSTLFRSRESSLLLLLWTSIPILLLSGASYPREAIPDWLYAMGKIFPSSSGVEGFIRLQTMGASYIEVLPQIRTLWILTIIYAGLACIGIHVVTTGNLSDQIKARVKIRMATLKNKIEVQQ